MMKSPKGVSPLIASVLLIAFTMMIAAVLTAWISSFTAAQKEKTAVFEEKIQCSSGFIENDADFTEYNYTDDSKAIFKTRIKNTGTIDISVGKYQIWFKDAAIPTIWSVDSPANYSIKKQDARIITLNASGGRLSKIKIMAYSCDGVTATISEPSNGWTAGNPSAANIMPAKPQ